VLEDRQHELALVLIERAERVVQKNPARPVQQQPGEGEALLLLKGQVIVPPLLTIERGQQIGKPDPLERGGDGRVVEASGRSRVAGAGAQTAERQVGPRRHQHHGVTRGQVDGAGAPGRQTRHRAEQGALVRAVLDDGSGRARPERPRPRLLEHSPAAGESEVEILQHQALGLVSGHRG
jgi:hypothetical protein